MESSFPELQRLDYLVDIESSQVAAFVDPENKKTLERLSSDSRFEKTKKDILDILSSKDKLPHPYFLGSELYDFWQDKKNVRGVFRKTTIESFNTGTPKWETVLDLDELAKKENANWVWKELTCFQPQNELCMIHLSDGGKDARISREFNLKTRSFVENGFFIAESKSNLAWLDKNTLLVSDATDTKTLSASGYPTQVRLWKRGNKLSEAPVVLTANPESMAVWVYNQYKDQKNYTFISVHKTFYSEKHFLVDSENPQKLTEIPLPEDADVAGIFKDHLLFTNRTPLKITAKIYPPGTLFALPLKTLSLENASVVFQPTHTQFFESSTTTKDFLLLTVLDDVKKSVFKFTFHNNHWSSNKLHLDDMGNAWVLAPHQPSNKVYFATSSFLNPTRYLYVDLTLTTPPHQVLQAPAHFDSSHYTVHQYKAKSSDGALIPYFIVHHKNLQFNGQHPTLLYGYGGFEYALTPYYLNVHGKAWLEKEGIYVLANIRGGGEYGPQWHQTVVRENRQKAFDDFYAIAEDLIEKKITSPRHLGIMGGSNGGLLTSVAFTQRSDLFNAAVIEVPLANMMRYHQWLAGNSWIEEYGNPEDPKMRDVLLKYSPLHNLKKQSQYLEPFYITSTKDDRVHPAHARQMVARMKELGHPVIYYENKNGGHGRSSNVNDSALILALEYIYLYQKLMN